MSNQGDGRKSHLADQRAWPQSNFGGLSQSGRQAADLARADAALDHPAISGSVRMGTTRLPDRRSSSGNWRCSALADPDRSPDGAIVVSTPSDVALQDARKAIEMFRQMKVDIVGIAENMSYFVCPHCQHEIDIFRAVARKRRRSSSTSLSSAASNSILRSAERATVDRRPC